MKVCICGSRNITDYELLKQCVIDSKFEITSIISGGAKGVDQLAIQYAKEFNIPWVEYLADWATHGRSAGIIRNKQMVDKAEGVIALWDGLSSGTANSISYAQKTEKPLFIWSPHRVNI